MSRLIKNALRVHIVSRIFLFCAVSVLLTSMISGITHRSGENGHYDSYYPLSFVIAIAAVFITMAFGLCGEFESGAVRNKLSHGFTKMQFFFSQLTAALAECVIFSVLAWVPYFIIAYGKFFSLFTGEVILRALWLLFASVLLMALVGFTVCITVRKTALAIIICALLGLGLEYASERLESDLGQPMYTFENGQDDYIYHPETDTLEYVVIREPDKVEYPWYVDGVEREIYYAGYVANPMTCLLCGWKYLMYSNDCFNLEDKRSFIEHHELFNDKYIYNTEFMTDSRIDNVIYPLWSGLTVLVLTGIGILIFRKRNIY